MERKEDFWEGIDHIPKPPRHDKYDHMYNKEDTRSDGEIAQNILDKFNKHLTEKCEASEHKPNPRYEMTAENEFDSIHKNPEGEVEQLDAVERGFETTFSYEYRVNIGKREGKKLMFATTETVDQGKDVVRIKLSKSYPNLQIHSIIHKED